MPTNSIASRVVLRIADNTARKAGATYVEPIHILIALCVLHPARLKDILRGLGQDDSTQLELAEREVAVVNTAFKDGSVDSAILHRHLTQKIRATVGQNPIRTTLNTESHIDRATGVTRSASLRLPLASSTQHVMDRAAEMASEIDSATRPIDLLVSMFEMESPPWCGMVEDLHIDESQWKNAVSCLQKGKSPIGVETSPGNLADSSIDTVKSKLYRQKDVKLFFSIYALGIVVCGYGGALLLLAFGAAMIGMNWIAACVFAISAVNMFVNVVLAFCGFCVGLVSGISIGNRKLSRTEADAVIECYKVKFFKTDKWYSLGFVAFLLIYYTVLPWVPASTIGHVIHWFGLSVLALISIAAIKYFVWIMVFAGLFAFYAGSSVMNETFLERITEKINRRRQGKPT
ncbi:MAG: hypothetical protein WBC05_18840 [Sedimentisphaerales bacterium]